MIYTIEKVNLKKITIAPSNIKMLLTQKYGYFGVKDNLRWVQLQDNKDEIHVAMAPLSEICTCCIFYRITPKPLSTSV